MHALLPLRLQLLDIAPQTRQLNHKVCVDEQLYVQLIGALQGGYNDSIVAKKQRGHGGKVVTVAQQHGYIAIMTAKKLFVKMMVALHQINDGGAEVQRKRNDNISVGWQWIN